MTKKQTFVCELGQIANDAEKVQWSSEHHHIRTAALIAGLDESDSYTKALNLLCMVKRAIHQDIHLVYGQKDMPFVDLAIRKIKTMI